MIDPLSLGKIALDLGSLFGQSGQNRASLIRTRNERNKLLEQDFGNLARESRSMSLARGLRSGAMSGKILLERDVAKLSNLASDQEEKIKNMSFIQKLFSPKRKGILQKDLEGMRGRIRGMGGTSF